MKDIQNHQFAHIENPLNENKPAYHGYDCQEIHPITGERMMSIFDSSNSRCKIYDDLKFYDDDDKRNQLIQTIQERLLKPDFEEIKKNSNFNLNLQNLQDSVYKLNVNNMAQKKNHKLQNFYTSPLETKAGATRQN